MTENDKFKYALVELVSLIREVADEEKTDLSSEYSRGRASGINAILLMIGVVSTAFELEPDEIGLKDFDVNAWYGG